MKKCISVLVILLLVASLALPTLAAEPRLDAVADAAGLLTTEQRSTLEQKAREIAKAYQCGVYIITMGDFTDYSNQSSLYEAAKELYLGYDLGFGEEHSGVLLVLSMAERDYTLLAYGYGNTAFTDYGKDRLADAFLDDFGDDDWYEGFDHYLTKSESMLRTARAGEPLDVGNSPSIVTAGVLISIALGCGVSLLICLGFKGTMKSVAIQTDADSYIQPGSVDFTIREDRFTHITRNRVKIVQKSDSGGSSGGGTTIDSSGFSGKSGKF